MRSINTLVWLNWIIWPQSPSMRAEENQTMSITSLTLSPQSERSGGSIMLGRMLFCDRDGEVSRGSAKETQENKDKSWESLIQSAPDLSTQKPKANTGDKSIKVLNLKPIEHLWRSVEKKKGFASVLPIQPGWACMILSGRIRQLSK